MIMSQELQIRGHMNLSYKNHSEEIFNILGIKPMEKFRIETLMQDEQKEYDNYTYYITSNLLCYEKGYCNECKNYTILPKLLSGELKIVKDLSIKNINLTPEEQTVIDYCKLCGYKYVAEDQNGEIWAYEGKPNKRDQMWNNYNGKSLHLEYNLSFLSWDDEEPWVIE